MKLYTVRINDRDIFTTKATDKIKAFSKIRQQLPSLLSYPYFWCLACCPNKPPATIPEKIIFYSKPYRYYMEYKRDPDRVNKIETNRGFYFIGKDIVECMKNINYMVTASDSSSSDPDLDDFEEDSAIFLWQNKLNIRKLRRREKLRGKKMRLMGKIYKTKKIKLKNFATTQRNPSQTSSNSSSYSETDSEPDDERDILKKEMICYFKKYMTLAIFNDAEDSSETSSIELIEKNCKKTTCTNCIIT